MSTIIVHPLFTHRASSVERVEASNSALRLLYDINHLAGPVNAGYTKAFKFRSERDLRLSRRQSVQSESTSSDGEAKKDFTSKYASSESIWWQADSLWDVVGWAFNCSIHHRKRWERWTVWLGWFIDALERDWDERKSLADEASSDDQAKDLIVDSLIYQNLEDVNSRTDARRVLRAILTDGVNQKPVKEFPEVWENETKERKVKDDTRGPRKKLDLDEGEFGDYDIDEDEDEIMEDTSDTAANKASKQDHGPRARKDNKNSRDPVQQGVAKFGGVDAVAFRQRLLGLVRHSASFSSSSLILQPLALQSLAGTSERLPACRNTL